jgi:predicted NUDIX family NTP pyrophosphohydrolase
VPTQLSAGIILWRPGRLAAADPGSSDPDAGEPDIDVLLVHSGGPHWARRDVGWWTIPKGAPEPGEEQLAAAEREFAEELGLDLPAGPRVDLGGVVQKAGKHVVAWAVAGDLDVADFTSNTFTMEWPPRSGQTRSFPEIDRAEWFALGDARRMILPAQAPLIERLVALLVGATDDGVVPGLPTPE